MITREFKMHGNLLKDVISRQAGTIDKAVLESVMNSIESGSSRIDVTVTEKHFIVKDDGHGFRTRQEIEEAFETFGKSDERAKEEKRFARFQIGRGQSFPFGLTTYRTRTFLMTVDWRSGFLGYNLEEGLADQPGCEVSVKLYEPMKSRFEVADVVKAIERNVKYVDVPIFVNDQQVNKDPREQKWTYDTPDAYIRLSDSSSSVSVYNRGVFVESVHGLGCGGVIVSKGQLTLNFARNQVLRTCPLWKRITHKLAPKKTSLLKKRSFTVEEAALVLAKIASGEVEARHTSHLRIFKDTRGRAVSPDMLAAETYVGFDRAGSFDADRAMTAFSLIVLDRGFLSDLLELDDKDKALYEGLCSLLGRVLVPYYPGHRTIPKLMDLKKAYAEFAADGQRVFPETELNQRERWALRILSYVRFSDRFGKALPDRKLCIGEKAGAAAWTDGETYIVFSRALFLRNLETLSGWMEIFTTLAHEYAHTGSERGHDGEFYERFHDIVDSGLKELTRSYKSYIDEINRAGRKVSNRQRLDIGLIEYGEPSNPPVSLAS